MSLKKQLIAEINKVEKELYVEKERMLEAKQHILTNKTAYLLGALLLTALPIILLCRPKTRIKGIANSLASLGTFALVTYCKKQITDLLENK